MSVPLIKNKGLAVTFCGVLSRMMHKNGLERKKFWETMGNTDPVVFQRPQVIDYL